MVQNQTFKVVLSLLPWLICLPIRAEELVRSRVAVLAMHEPREVAYYNDLRRSLYEAWTLRIVRGLDRLTGLRIDGNDWTFRGVALLLLVAITILLFWGFLNQRRRSLAYSFAFGLLISMVGWIGLYAGVASLNQFDMKGAHHVQKLLDITTAWGLETDVYWEWAAFKKQWEDKKILPYTVVCWMGVPLGADEMQMEEWLNEHKEQKLLQVCLGAQLPKLFHKTIFLDSDPYLGWSKNSAHSVCELKSAYERTSSWQSALEHFDVKTVAWNKNLVMYGQADADPKDIARWLEKSLDLLGYPWASFNARGVVALRLDDPGSASNAYLETWRFPAISSSAWYKVENTLAQHQARMTIGYVPAWLDDGHKENGELEVDGQVILSRSLGGLYPSANVKYSAPKIGVFDLVGQANVFRQSKVLDMELHGFTHITPEVERWAASPHTYAEADWYREFLGTEQRPFVQRSDVVQRDLMKRGRKMFEQSFSHWPSILIPPGHAISWDTAEIAFQQGFVAMCDKQMVLNVGGQVRRSRLLPSVDISLQPNSTDLPTVLILHDRDLALEKESWFEDRLQVWEKAGVTRFVSVREWVDLWKSVPQVSFTQDHLILETSDWPDFLRARLGSNEMARVKIHLPAAQELAELPSGLAWSQEGDLTWPITGTKQRWEIPFLAHD